MSSLLNIPFSKYLMALCFFALAVPAQAQVLDSCVLEIKIDEEESSLIEMLVQKTPLDEQKLALVYSDSELVINTTDVAQKTYAGEDLKTVYKETPLGMIASTHKVSLKKMTEAQVSFIDKKANDDDASGAVIITALDQNKKVIAKLAQVGWAHGVCR